MDDNFSIQIDYKGRQQHFEAVFTQYGYSYRITVPVQGTEIIFEPDEERKFRAMLSNPLETGKPPDAALIKLLGERLEEMFHS